MSWRRRPEPAPPTPPATPGTRDAALFEPRTAASLRRLAWSAWCLLVVGIVGAAVMTLSFIAGAHADAELRATGDHTSGTVLFVDPDSKGSPGGAEVAFWDGQATQMTYVRLDSYAGDYSAGQHVAVVYDPHDWDRITLDDVPWTPPGADLAQSLSIVPTMLGLLIGGMLVWTRSRTQRLLSGRVWTPVRVTVERGHGRHFSTEDTYWESYTAGRWPGGTGEQDAWWVSDGRRAVFSPDQGGPLVLAKIHA